MNICYTKLIKPFSLIILLIIIYITIYYHLNIPSYLDPLLIEPNIKYLRRFLNGWSISHLISFAIIGYHYPDCLEAAMVYGLLWEGFEFGFGELMPVLFPKFTHKIDPTWSLWYYGRFEDIIMNFIGFLIGKYLREYLDSNYHQIKH